ncbi:MAG TPA: glycosyltransferase family 2 protein [Pirellulaceae bacterium]|nr:glycosyltransferase family 2 protein [Pirellulaceae bacterium]
MSIATLPTGVPLLALASSLSESHLERLQRTCDELALLSGELPDDTDYTIPALVEPLPAGQRVSLVVPVRNAEATIRQSIARARKLPFPHEIVLVDDGSHDRTPDYLTLVEHQPGLHVICKPHRQGFGAAIRTGLNHASGDYVVIWDQAGLLELRDVPKLLTPLLRGEVELVCGVRPKAQRSQRWLTRLTNRCLPGKRADVTAGCVALKRELLDGLRLRSSGVELAAELAAKLARRHTAICEVPLEYSATGEPYAWRQSLAWLLTLARYRWFD